MKRLSVIILTYNSEKDIYECLDSAYKYNDIGEDLEIIVVDNQSREYEAMRMRLAKDYPQVRVVQNTHNGGYGQGNNVGIRMAKAPIVAIMNPDVRLLMPTFGEMLRCFDDPQVIMCGGKQMYPNNVPGWSFAYDFTTLGVAQVLLRHLMQHYDIYDNKRMWLSGAFFAIRKEHFKKIGLFDESIFMYGEECDIHLRLRNSYPTMKIIYLQNIPYLHLSYRKEFSEVNYKQHILSCIYVCQKHRLSEKIYLHIERFANIVCNVRAILCKKEQEKRETRKAIDVINSIY